MSDYYSALDDMIAMGAADKLAAHEAAAQRRALARIRANVISAIRDAMTFQSEAADALWTALRVLDTECVAAGLPSALDAGGGLS